MRYWIVSELFYPEEVSTGYVMTKIAETIAETDEVNVICGPANYQATGVFNATYPLSARIKIHRIRTPRLNKNKLYLRFLSFLFLTLGVGMKVLFKVSRKDKVVLVTNPPTVTLLVPFLKRIIGFKLLIIVHDVFPENMASANILKKKSFIYRVLRKLFNFAYGSASRLVVVGQDMQELFATKVNRELPVRVITNWADHNEVVPDPSINVSQYYNRDFSGRIVCGFAGNIGRVQGLDHLFLLLKTAKPASVDFVFIGDGAMKEELQRMKSKYALSFVHFYSSKPRSEQTKFLNACDIGLVSLSPGMFGLGVPSKVYNILAAGKPLLYFGDQGSEISRYIVDNNVGWSFSWDMTTEIIDFFQALDRTMLSDIHEKGRRARKLVEQRFTKATILQQYKEEILKL